jgi:hypothetical protein
MMYAVTIKLSRNPKHDPRNKKIGTCPAMGGECTDITGEHHTYVVHAKSTEDAYDTARIAGFDHVTRIESV